MLRGWGRAALAFVLLPPASAVTTALLDAPPLAAAAPAAQRFGFQAVTPYRLIDTRDAGLPVGPGQTITVGVLGQGPIPSSGVTSVAINVTITEPTEPSYVTVWPAGGVMPETSTVNFAPGVTVPNAAIVAVGDNGALSLYNLAGTAHVIVDVTGWFPTGSGFTGVAPQRLLDTRTSPGRVPLGPADSIDVQVTGVAGVPASGVSAVALNVTATEPTAPGYLTVWPAGSALPLASNVNMLPGQSVANSAVVGVGATGAVSIFNRFGSTHVVVDITGYVEFDRGYVPVTPIRLSDSRVPSQNVNGLSGPLLGGQVVSLSGSFSRLAGSTGPQAFGPTAVVLNVTITRPTRPAFLTVFPHRAPLPLASNLNFLPLQTVANTVIVGTDRDGDFDLFLSGGGSDVVVDLVGYFPADGLGLVDLNWNARGAALGVDNIAVAFCEPAPTDHSEEMAAFHDVVAPFYAWLSGGRYAMQFADAGSLTATDPTDCYDRLGGLPVAPGTEAVLAVYGYDTNPNAAWGFASTSVTADDVPSFPLDRRAGVVSLSTVARLGAHNPFWMVAAHEFGHTLDYPHSFVDTATDLGYRQQYTNPMDLMSSQPLADRSYAPQATLAINRFRSGWIDPDEVTIHRASDATYTIAPIGAGGTQMVVIPSSTPGRFTTLDARVRQGYDQIIDTEGVEVDVVDATCSLVWCSGITSRISPAWGGYDSVDHVLGVGEAHALGGVTVSVLEQNLDGSFVVRVTGTTYDFPALSSSGLTGADHAAGIDYVWRLPGTNP